MVEILLTLVGFASSANDGSGVLGVGGTVAALNGHPSIQMVRERVRIKLPSGKVATEFVFRNHGKETLATMVFPENGGIAEFTHHAEPVVWKRTHFGFFRSWVDARPIDVRRAVWDKHFEGGFYYKYWWSKQVPFLEGQTRVVRNEYRGGIGWGGTGEPGTKTFEYILRTGASWHGPIERAEIVVEIDGLERTHDLFVSPPGFRRTAKHFSWRFENFEPKNDIEIRWTPKPANL